ncbi:unnamed protein product [Sphagnum jensenii]
MFGRLLAHKRPGRHRSLPPAVSARGSLRQLVRRQQLRGRVPLQVLGLRRVERSGHRRLLANSERQAPLLKKQQREKRVLVRALVEKAYAKFRGSYEALNGGQTIDALISMSGGIEESYDLLNPTKIVCDKNAFWSILLTSFKKNAVVCCSISAADNMLDEPVQANGLIRQHAYVVTNVAEVVASSGEASSNYILDDPSVICCVEKLDDAQKLFTGGPNCAQKKSQKLCEDETSAHKFGCGSALLKKKIHKRRKAQAAGLNADLSASRASVNFRDEFVAQNEPSRVRLIKLYNPWGNEVEWNGNWCDASHKWASVEGLDKIEFKASNDGEFWMCFDDWLSNFNSCQICNVTYDATEELYNDNTISYIYRNKCLNSKEQRLERSEEQRLERVTSEETSSPGANFVSEESDDVANSNIFLNWQCQMVFGTWKRLAATDQTEKDVLVEPAVHVSHHRRLGHPKFDAAEFA